MQDHEKNQNQLIDELNEMRRRIAELETGQATALHAENDLLKSRQDWKDIFQAIGHPTIIMDREHRILAANRATIEATGKSLEQLLNAKCYEIFHNAGEAPKDCPMEALLKSGSIEPVEMEMEALGGHFLVSCTPLFDKDGTVQKIIHIATDITARKMAEDEAQRNEARLVRIIDILHYKADSVQDFLDYALSEALELTHSKIGYIYHYREDSKEFVLDTWSTEVMKECSITNPPAVYQLENTGIWGEAVRQRQPILVNDFQAPHPLKKGYPEGHAPLYRYLTIPVFSGNQIVAVVGVANKESDYSQTDTLQLTLLMDSVWKGVERLQAEDELRRNEFRFVRAELIARLGNWEIDLSTKRVTASDGAKKIYGLGHQELTLEDIQKFPLPEYRSQLDAALLGLIKDGTPYDVEFQIKRANDDQVIDIHSVAHYDAEKNSVFGTIHDITDLRHAEESHKLLFEAMEHAAEAIIITDSSGTIQYVNPAQEITSGYSRNELLGQTPNIFRSDFQDNNFYDRLWKTINSGNVWSGRFVNRKKDGTVYHEDATISPVYTKTGKLTNFVAVKHDITERLKLSEQLFQAQKMEAVGTLAGGVAHDFNNLLQAVLGYSELMLQRKKEGERDYADLKRIYQAGKRGAELVKNLMTFSRKAETKFVPVDLNQEINSARNLLSRTIPKTINIDLRLREDLESIRADRSQIGQVLMNLGVNARDAMPDGGILTIETANIRLDEEYYNTHPETIPGSYVLLTVSDTGQGMDKETLSHIFEPFFTTKERGRGTGLGLATVYGIVKQHDGHIMCYSEPGHGTTFKIYLPAIQTELELNPTTVETAIPGGTETILLVDDDDDIRDLGATLLIEFGYKVIMAVNGKDALEIYRKEKDSIALILLDLIMPEMDGRQCLAEILRVDRNAKVVIASGYSQNGPANGATTVGAKGFVRKPYDMRQLLTTIREVLDKD